MRCNDHRLRAGRVQAPDLAGAQGEVYIELLTAWVAALDQEVEVELCGSEGERAGGADGLLVA